MTNKKLKIIRTISLDELDMKPINYLKNIIDEVLYHNQEDDVFLARIGDSFLGDDEISIVRYESEER